MNTTSIVIVSYYTGAALWICLRRALQLQGVQEVIVVNNGNGAQVEMRLKALSQARSNVRLVSGHGNVGFAAGCNLGVKAATGRFILLLNPDAVFMENNAMITMMALFDTPGLEPPVGLVGTILRNDDGSEQRASRRNLMTPQNALFEGFGLHKLFTSLPRLNLDGTPMPAHPSPIPAISGACMMMERARYEQIGGMDEDYFLHVEDMDLCARVNHGGGGVWIVPNINLLHYRSTSEVASLFVEQHKTRGFITYFDAYFSQFFWRSLAKMAAWGKLAGKILASFRDEWKPEQQLKDAIGIRRVQAIARAMTEAHEENMMIPMPCMTVCVTGASTAVGLFAIGRLLAVGCRVVAIKHKTHVGFFDSNMRWVEGDFEKPQKLAETLRSYECTHLLHAAPIWRLPQILPALAHIGIKRLSVISSTSLITKKNSSDAQERATAQKLAEGETGMAEIAGRLGIDWTILRPTMIYGAGLDENIARIAHAIDRTRRFILPKYAVGKRAPVHAGDVAKAAVSALVQDVARSKIYHISGGTTLFYAQLPEKIAEAMGVPVRIFALPGLVALCGMLHPWFPKKIPALEVALRTRMDMVFPDDHLTEELGVTPRPFLRDGLIDLGQCREAVCSELLPNNLLTGDSLL